MSVLLLLCVLHAEKSLIAGECRRGRDRVYLLPRHVLPRCMCGNVFVQVTQADTTLPHQPRGDEYKSERKQGMGSTVWPQIFMAMPTMFVGKAEDISAVRIHPSILPPSLPGSSLPLPSPPSLLLPANSSRGRVHGQCVVLSPPIF